MSVDPTKNNNSFIPNVQQMRKLKNYMYIHEPVVNIRNPSIESSAILYTSSELWNNFPKSNEVIQHFKGY